MRSAFYGALATGCVALAANAGLAQVTIYAMPPIPLTNITDGFGVSSDGLTAVGTSTGGQSVNKRAVRWTVADGTMSLGSLGTLDTNFTWAATAANANGTAITGTSNGRSFLWTPQTGMFELGFLNGCAFGSGNGISEDGGVVVGTATSCVGTGSRAFVWKLGQGYTVLPMLPGGFFAVGQDISGDGTIAVGYAGTDVLNQELAFRWTSETGTVALPLLTDQLPLIQYSARAGGISRDGRVIVGRARNEDFLTVAVRWLEDGTVESLGLLPNGNDFSEALATNADGSVVVGRGNVLGGLPGQRAMLWTAELGMVNLNDYLPSIGVDTTGWFFSEVSAVSADGTTIVGFGLFQSQQRGFVITGLPIVVTPPACTGDLDGDGVVDADDLGVLLAAFGTSGAGDLNGDGITDADDLGILLAAFGNSCD